MPQSKFIYFDIGGVLMDYRPPMEKLAAQYGVTVADFDRIYELYGHKAERGDITLQDVWYIYEEELGLQRAQNFDFLEYWAEHLLPIQENHEALRYLLQTYRVGIISNMYKDAIPKLLQKGKIPNVRYSTIIESSGVRVIKPEEKIYQIAQHAAGTNPNDIIYIDDRKDFVDFAKTLGWNGVWYTQDNGTHLQTVLAELLES